MTPHTTIITPTYNKPRYLAEAYQSLTAQTDYRWIWWLALDGPCGQTRATALKLAKLDSRVRLFDCGTTEEQRVSTYRPAEIANELYPQVQTRFVKWLSDDDLMAPQFLEIMTGALHATCRNVAYCRAEFVTESDGGWRRTGQRPRQGLPVYSRYCLPDKELDWGQVLHTMDAYRSILPWQFPTGDEYDHCDGLFLNELAERFDFLPCKEFLFTRRKTSLSESVVRRRAM